MTGAFTGQIEYEASPASQPALRDALLPKLISGELRVGDAEHLVVRNA